MSSMLLTIDLILLWLRQTHQNNRNSSIPPSKPNRINSPWRKNWSQGKRQKKRHGLAHNGYEPKTITVAEVKACQICNDPLTDVPGTHYERRTKIDIVFEKVVRHVEAEIRQCP